MEDFKKELFFQEHSAHIAYLSISESEKLFLNSFLQQEYGISATDREQFFNALLKELPNKKGYESIDTSLELAAIFQDLVLQNDKEVFVIWNYPENIDKFDLDYLLKYWEDIWFGASDEAVGIFFPLTDRIIVITHYNVVYY